ncbi:MAG: Aminopeptidase N-terminal protein [Patescibacteria group bacterium]|nr:aminopeptidase P N-terminal domain-containing protein [Candidatus Saccharibacteria bacterium]MDQ5963480.1 Aminopeptidase N-terminal protein [Patescibacteria group bacterium]
MLAAPFFRSNRNKLRKSLDGACAVVAGNGSVQRKSDTTFSFAQDGNFWYLTGVNEPDCVLFLGATEADDFLITPDKTATQEAFDGIVDHEKICTASGIGRCYTAREGWKRVERLLGTQTTLYTLPGRPAYDVGHGMYRNPAPTAVARKLKRRLPNLTQRDIRPHIASLRAIKSSAEIRCIQKAIDTTTEGLEVVRQKLEQHRYNTEAEIEAELTYLFRTRGASGHAYQPIVAGGKNSTVLHYVQNDSRLASGTLLVLDVGAEYSQYCADITRTLPIGNRTERQASVYDAVLRIQVAAIELLRPGLSFREFEESVRQNMASELAALGLVKDKNDHASVAQYYPHATTHFLGLDVHDVGNYNEPMRPGMIITCEPGIYIPEEGIGVRIEDDILITKDGHQNLSAACPK